MPITSMTMRLHAVSLTLLVFLAACAGTTQVAESLNAADVAETKAPPVVRVAGEQPEVDAITDPPEVWDGFASTAATSQGLAAMARGPVDVFTSPNGDKLEVTLEGTTILGTATVLAVVEGPEGGWAEVMLPVRPNGSTGWVRVDDVSLYMVDGEIHIDISERTLTYVVDGVEILETDVGIGSDHNQTPIGEFFVTDNVTLADPNSPWGPHALGISARSDTITEFNGGDGIIGIHGTNNPGSIGGNISLGCVRLPNDMITALHEMVPIGTRVVVSA